MSKNLREVLIELGNESMIIELEQGEMSEDRFIEYAIDYVLSYIQVSVL